MYKELPALLLVVAENTDMPNPKRMRHWIQYVKSNIGSKWFRLNLILYNKGKNRIIVKSK